MSSLIHTLAEKYKLWAETQYTESITKGICADVKKQCEWKTLTKAQITEVQNYWEPLVGKTVDVRMHQAMLSLTGIFKPEFEPFEICREVQNRSMIPGAMRFLDDKNLYRDLLNGFNVPTRVAECNNGVYYLPEIHNSIEVSHNEFIRELRNVSDCIIKPSVGSDGGRGVHSFDVAEGVEIHTQKKIEEIVKDYGRNFCIERKVHECDNLQQLNPTSCNTLRIHTMRCRKEHRIRLLSGYVRIGKMGQVVDNMLSGGTGARIYDDGRLKNTVSCYPYRVYSKTESGVNLDGYQIENYSKIIDTCLAAHSRLPMFDLMGWDVTVDKEGNVIIIEYNPNPDIRIEQAIFGDTCLLDNQEWVMKQYYK